MPIEAPLAHARHSHAENYRSLPSTDRSSIDESDLVDADLLDHAMDSPRGYSPGSAVLRVDTPAGAVETDPDGGESALAVLAHSSVAELRFLRVDESEGAIHLTGQVGSFYHKQLAQE